MNIFKAKANHPQRFCSVLSLLMVMAALGVLRAAPATAATLTVTNADDSGAGSLRQAIADANASAEVADTITFAIGSGEQTITVLSALPDITDALTIDGSTQPGFAGTPIVVLRPALELTAASGLRLRSDRCTIKALAINGFANEISMSSSNSRVQGCYLGVNTAGTAAVGNGAGVIINADSNSVGGTTAGTRNIIARGISIIGAFHNTIIGNYIGTNATSTAILGTGGISIDSSTGNTIGGTVAGARNVIAGNITMSAADGNVVQGNYIGTNAAGTAALGSGGGISIAPGFANLIGGTTPGARNVIAGGIAIEHSTFSGDGNTIQGNYIGVNAAGTAALRGGSSGGSVSGIVCRESNNTIIGGTTAAARNVISGHSGHGIVIDDANGNSVQGNYIGTNASGTAAIGNGGDGVRILGIRGSRPAIQNRIGGTEPGAGNLISGNNSHGVFIRDIYLENWEEVSNTIQGNYIGTNAAGTAAIGNGGDGVRLDNVAEHTIGGTATGARNVIAGNNGDGIGVYNECLAVQIQGNYIGTNAAGTVALGNKGNGITALNMYGIVGGTTTGARNIISGNAGHGIYGSEAAGFYYGLHLSIEGNTIGTNLAGTGALGNGGDGIRITNGFGNVGGVGASGSNRIAFNGGNGIRSLEGTVVRGNAIFNNTKLGIDVGNDGVTPNDRDKAGSDGAQDFPIITGVLQADGVTILSGTLDSGSEKTYFLDFYHSETPDPSSYGEGEVYIGSTSVITDANGKVTFNFSFPGSYAGQTFAATATAREGYWGRPTSEFGPTRFSISGRITTSDGTGVAGASVSRSGSSTAEGNSTTVQTDADGNYAFTGVAPGIYTVNATGSGYTFAAANFTNPVNVQNSRSDINFTATKLPAGSYSISGRVANHSGVGMVNISVTLNGNRQVATDSNGNYTFTGVLNGTYLIKPVITPSLSGVTFSPSQLTVVVNGRNFFNQNFTAGFVIGGRVTNHSGVGIPNVLVQRKAGSSVIGIYTDSNGNYTFSNVRSGSYTIAPLLTPAMSGMSFTPISRTVTIDRSNVFNQSFIGMFSVSGYATNHAGAGLSNVLVRLRDKASGAYVTSQSTDGGGYYQIRNVRSGSYTVAPELTPSMSGMSFTPLLREFEVSKTNIISQNFIAMFSISGRITTSAGAGVANVLVRLNTDTTSTSTRTDANGNYRFSDVRSGQYTVVPEGSGFTPASRAVTVEKQNLININFIGPAR